MKPRIRLYALGLTLLVLTLINAIANAQVPGVWPPLSYPMWLKLRNNPDALRQLQLPPPPATPGPALASTVSPWQPLTNNVAISYSNPLLMTDGTVIMHNASAQDWWKLTPDINGSYVNGTWSQIASLPAGYGPLYFGSAVLPDGRVVINGGEYNLGQAADTNKGAIYSSQLGFWRSISPPAGWANIGDASTVVLSDGTYMLANALTKQQALLSTSSSGGISTTIWAIIGTGKFDINDEEGWTLLPSGNVLTVDTYVGQGTCGRNSELYGDMSGIWTSAGNTPNQLADCTNTFEMGPQVLRPDGTVVAFGATTSGVAHTAIFNSSTSTWAAGPDLPAINGQNYTLADAPAALLPSGNVLFAASPGAYVTPTHFFELDMEGGINQVADTPEAPFISCYYVNFLVLPTGQILATDFLSVQIYTPSGAPDPSWAPVIASYPGTVVRGTTYQLTGSQFNGLSQGAAYGDDVQAATNFPIVQLVNSSTGHVFYAQTSGFNTMSVAPNTSSSTNFVASGNTETGLSQLSVIANGIASQAVPVVVQ
jgi:hypothetical protein